MVWAIQLLKLEVELWHLHAAGDSFCSRGVERDRNIFGVTAFVLPHRWRWNGELGVMGREELYGLVSKWYKMDTGLLCSGVF